MEPISPVLTPELVANERTYAKDQPQYIPLPTIVSEFGVVLSRWRLTDEERASVARGGDVFLQVYRGRASGNPLEPVRLEIAETPEEIMQIAGRFGLIAFNTELPPDTVYSETTIQVPDLTKSQESAQKES